MEFYKQIMELTGSDANTKLGTMAIKVLRLVGEGRVTDMEVIKWACYIVADCCGHPSDPGYDEKFLALESGQ